MGFHKSKGRFSRRVHGPGRGRPEAAESTGSEVAYLRSLVDSGRMVTVVLLTGEQLRGRIRYFDRDCFSLGLVDPAMNLFLRKSNVLLLREG